MIAETPNGLVAAWFGGTKERNPDVGIWVSRIENGKWTALVEVANGIVNEKLRYACWNPVLSSNTKGRADAFLQGRAKCGGLERLPDHFERQRQNLVETG